MTNEVGQENHQGGTNKLRYLPQFHDEVFESSLKEEGAYGNVSSEEAKRMEGRLDELGELLEGSGVDWTLNGATNISLIKGKFFRKHKDTDISVFDSDLPELYENLLKKGFTITHERKDLDTAEKRCIEVVTPLEITSQDLHGLGIARMKSDGTIDPDLSKINFIDLHIYKRDENGNVVISTGREEIRIPSKYYEGRKQYRTLNNHTIPLESLAVVVLMKAVMGREHDFADIPYALENLSNDDKSFILSEAYRVLGEDKRYTILKTLIHE